MIHRTLKNSSNCKCYTCRLQGSKECVMCPINFKKNNRLKGLKNKGERAMEQLYKDKEYKRIIKEEWEAVRLPIKHYLDKTGKSIKFTCKKVNK